MGQSGVNHARIAGVCAHYPHGRGHDDYGGGAGVLVVGRHGMIDRGGHDAGVTMGNPTEVGDCREGADVVVVVIVIDDHVGVGVVCHGEEDDEDEGGGGGAIFL